jgi:pyridoxamine 5'-phosphate oxidase
MKTAASIVSSECLPDPLPADPLAIAAAWLAEAKALGAVPNPNAMILATVDDRGMPSARVVLCKDISAAGGSIGFYTNYRSRKGRELLANRRAAVVFHWDHQSRQVRAEGLTARMSEAESDAYFQTRPWQSQLGAWASEQSDPVGSREELVARVAEAARRFGIAYRGPGSLEPETVGVTVPRPPHWGGFRIHVEAMELWVAGEYRIHDRARWTRLPTPGGESPTAHPAWVATRLQP